MTAALDDEISSGDAGAEPSAPVRPAKAPLSPEQRRQRRRLSVVGVVIVAAIGFLLYKGLTTAIVYFKTTNEAVAQRAQLGDSTFQLEGTVVQGTVRSNGRGTVAFAITGGGKLIHVVNSGSPPQLFRPGIPVVVVGHFVGAGDDFASDQILVKHSNQYIAAHPNRVKVTPTTATGASADSASSAKGPSR